MSNLFVIPHDEAIQTILRKKAISSPSPVVKDRMGRGNYSGLEELGLSFIQIRESINTQLLSYSLIFYQFLVKGDYTLRDKFMSSRKSICNPFVNFSKIQPFKSLSFIPSSADSFLHSFPYSLFEAFPSSGV